MISFVLPRWHFIAYLYGLPIPIAYELRISKNPPEQFLYIQLILTIHK